jgi:hypothetical protein
VGVNDCRLEVQKSMTFDSTRSPQLPRRLAAKYDKSGYGQYLQRLTDEPVRR